MIDIVFPVYVPDEQVAEIQRACFASFREHTCRPCRVIVVDNGSLVQHDISVADVYVRLPQPVGFAAAVNLGWRLCDAEYVCVANNDLEFTAGWLDSLVGAVITGRADIVAPCDGTPAEFWGACFLMPRRVREAIGPFDAGELPWRFHDQDYWIRAMRDGYRFQRCPGSQVVHHESATWSKLPFRQAAEDAERAVMVARWGTDSAEAWRAGRMGGGSQPR